MGALPDVRRDERIRIRRRTEYRADIFVVALFFAVVIVYSGSARAGDKIPPELRKAERDLELAVATAEVKRRVITASQRIAREAAAHGAALNEQSLLEATSAVLHDVEEVAAASVPLREVEEGKAEAPPEESREIADAPLPVRELSIGLAVRSKLLLEGTVGRTVKVGAADGGVVLSGQVGSFEEKVRAEQVARAAAGGEQVQSYVEINPELAPPRLVDRFISGLMLALLALVGAVIALLGWIRHRATCEDPNYINEFPGPGFFRHSGR